MKAWWRKDEWTQTSNGLAVKTLEKHGCPSWDITYISWKKYKHKDTCETRVKNNGEFILDGRETVFEDPSDGMKFLGKIRPHINDIDIYDGPKYDK